MDSRVTSSYSVYINTHRQESRTGLTCCTIIWLLLQWMLPSLLLQLNDTIYSCLSVTMDGVGPWGTWGVIVIEDANHYSGNEMTVCNQNSVIAIHSQEVIMKVKFETYLTESVTMWINSLTSSGCQLASPPPSHNSPHCCLVAVPRYHTCTFYMCMCTSNRPAADSDSSVMEVGCSRLS